MQRTLHCTSFVSNSINLLPPDLTHEVDVFYNTATEILQKYSKIDTIVSNIKLH